uniref:Raftlin n=1 Tax=Knipowitschia caucasica TaxID=637954 RepID=A0AAV2MGG7_KNICA
MVDPCVTGAVSAGGTSTLRLSSVREVPAYLQELYLQGFVLAALHPFIQPCVPGPESPEHQLYRAILVRHEGGDRGPSLGPQYRLQLEECVCADQEPSPELIQGYVKKHIQDAADQGVMFVGFIQEAQGAPSRREADLRSLSLSLSLSLHSSPSSVLGSLNSSPPHSPPERDRPAEGREDEEERSATCRSEEGTPRLNNNATDAKEGPRPQRQSHGPELLALYHLPPPREPLPREPLPPEPPPREPVPREPPMRFYTVKVPLRLQSSSDGGVSALDGPWLDHLTQHFSSGASLVHGHFSLLQNSDVGPKAVESVFIFQEPAEAEATVQAFDAIVVEQWTVIHGLQVKADYVPLLQSLASFGWRLTCVLPTPVVRSNSDGSLSTKQIVFLQRPVQSRKKKDSKKLIFKARSKSNKNCIKDSVKSKKRSKKEADEANGRTTERNTDHTNRCSAETQDVGEPEEPREQPGEPGGEPGEPGDMSTAEVQAETKEVVETGLETEPEEPSAENEIITKETEGESNQSA